MSDEVPQPVVNRWADVADAPFDEPVFLIDEGYLPTDLTNASVVLPNQGGERARELLILGAARVLLADAALMDSSLIGRLATEFGSERVGVWMPAKPMEISWTLDSVSNADFKCLTPSIGKPGWEVLKSDDSRTGTEVGWWIGQMLALGASVALVSVDMESEADFDSCAELIERFGERLWLTPLRDNEPDLQAWVQYGNAGNLVLAKDTTYAETAPATLEVSALETPATP